MRRDARSGRARGRGVGFGAGCALAVTVAVLYAPLLQLVVSSVNRNRLTARWEGFTSEWWSAALGNDEVRAAALRSLRLALLVALSAGLIGTAAAIATRRHPRVRAVVSALATARLAVPEIVLAVALAVVLPLVDVRAGPLAMWFGHTVFLSGYVVLVVGARVADLDPALEDAAADLGASPRRVLLRIVLPQVAPAVAAATVLVAAFSFDDVLLSSRLGGPTDTTLPVVIVSMATRRTTPELDAIGALVVGVGVVAFAVAALVARGRGGLAPEAAAVRTLER